MNKLTAIYEFAKQHWGKVVVITLAVLLILEHQRYGKIVSQFSDAMINSAKSIEKLKGELKLKDDELAAIKIQGGRVVWLTRTVAGGAVTGHQGPYLPPEGYVLVKVGDKPGAPPIIIIQDWGFTLRPGYGLVWSSKFLPELDLKFFFWHRWSAKAGVNLEFADIGPTRHIDDFPLCSKFNNVELQIVGGVAYKGEKRIGIGLRSNL